MTLREDAESARRTRAAACVRACEGLVDPSVVPELLAEVKALMDFLHARRPAGWTQEDSLRVEAAIAKAEGR